MRATITPAALAAAVCLVQPASAQDYGPGAFGYFGNDIANNFLDISTTGTDIAPFFTSLDDGGLVVLLDFDFTLYGVASGAIGIGTNGYLSTGSDLTDFTNDCPLADSLDPNRGIYPFWDDLNLNDHGSLFVQSFGAAPNRVFISQWDDVGFFSDSTASLTFQAQLFEAGNAIEYHYAQMNGVNADGASAGIGTEGDSVLGSLVALEIACDDPGTVVSNMTAYRIEIGPAPPPPPPMYAFSSIAPNFLDISPTGIDVTGTLGPNLDDSGIVVPIGFNFEFFGSSLTSIGFTTNGYLADDSDLTDFTNDCPIANPITPNKGIYPFFDDLRLTEHGQMFRETFGLAPNRVFIAQWDNVGTFDDSTANLTFQAQLYEDCSAIEFHYDELTDGVGPGFDASGGSATVGIEAPNGASGTQISCDQTGSVLVTTAYRLVITGSQTPRFATVPNPGTFSPDPAGGPLINTIWAPSVSGAVASAALDVAIISTQSPIDLLLPFGSLVCNISTPLLQVKPAGGPFAVPIPNDCNLVGSNVCSQGAQVSLGPLTIGLANGLDLIIGTL